MNGDLPANVRDSFAKAKAEISKSIVDYVDRGERVSTELDKTLISLSAGALIFTMTFVGTFAPGKRWLPLLFAAWVSFGGSMICVVLSMRRAQTGITDEVDKLSKLSDRLQHDEELLASEVAQLPAGNSVEMPPSPILRPMAITNPKVANLNRWALRSFILGIVFLGVFVGYNLWTSRPQSRETRCERLAEDSLKKHEAAKQPPAQKPSPPAESPDPPPTVSPSP